jgi:hypothetical protein
VGRGHPILGYDIDVNGYKLVVNPSEAERVRTIFQLYLEHQSLLPVVLELERRAGAEPVRLATEGPDPLRPLRRGHEPVAFDTRRVDTRRDHPLPLLRLLVGAEAGLAYHQLHIYLAG